MFGRCIRQILQSRRLRFCLSGVRGINVAPHLLRSFSCCFASSLAYSGKATNTLLYSARVNLPMRRPPVNYIFAGEQSEESIPIVLPVPLTTPRLATRHHSRSLQHGTTPPHLAQWQYRFGRCLHPSATSIYTSAQTTHRCPPWRDHDFSILQRHRVNNSSQPR